MPPKQLSREVARFLAEDVGAGDITTGLVIGPRKQGRALIVAREPCVLAGSAATAGIVASRGRALRLVESRQDGSRLRRGDAVAVIEGSTRDLLTIERTLLNLLGRLSGVATLTAEFVDRVRSLPGAHAVICDTRKTTPGLRAFEKYAVRCGGGVLHRIGLFDAILVKDNHLAALAHEPGGALEALRARLERLRAGARARTRRAPSAQRPPSFIEVEVDRLDQLEEILRWPRGVVDIVLLDNMTPALMRRAVRLRDRAKSSILLEASGGVTLRTVAAIARSGVDRISVGALTHSARGIDFAMEMEPSARSASEHGTPGGGAAGPDGRGGEGSGGARTRGGGARR